MRKTAPLLIGFLFVCGLSILLYPTASDLLARRNHSRAIAEYGVTVEALAAKEIEEQFARAYGYNSTLTGAVAGDFFSGEQGGSSADYLSTLNIGGMMGYLEIPSIQVNLPIYHTTSAEVLRKGVGHISASALPVGGEGCHAVLTAHRGLPSAKLFTDLNKLEPGDLFYIRVLDQVLGYQVDRILVVEPFETGDLQPVKDRDYLTLVTCTPYGVNSHRLLVRGERIALEEAALQPARETEGVAGSPARSAVVAPVLVTGAIFAGSKLRRMRRRR